MLNPAPSFDLKAERAKRDAEGRETRSPPVTVGLLDFLGRELPTREHILSPWLPTQGLAMLYAPRGIGKTHLALDVGYTVTAGGKLLGWQAPKPRAVLYLDGEMPAATLQERLASIVAAADHEAQAGFCIITPDLQPPELGMPDLATPEGREAIDAAIEQHGSDLIIVDNLSTLVRAAKENEAEGWLPVQEWALRQRACGRSVLFIHHAGKGGNQRGTSRREDVLDTVIALRRPADYSPDKGATFEVHFEKARGLFGTDAAAIEAQLTEVGGRRAWTWRALEDSTYERVITMMKDGTCQRDIADALRIDKSNVSRHVRKARENGRLPTEKGGK